MTPYLLIYYLSYSLIHAVSTPTPSFGSLFSMSFVKEKLGASQRHYPVKLIITEICAGFSFLPSFSEQDVWQRSEGEGGFEVEVCGGSSYCRYVKREAR